MAATLDEQIKQLKQAIAEMEAQRPVLGDAAVDASLVPFREKLAELEMLAESPKEAPSDIPVRKRKLVTLLYIDVVGSTAMTQGLDPEDTMEIMEKAILRLAAPIETHGGHVTRFTGDGFKAIFGDPVAREGDPEQAVRAGLEILDVSKAVAQEIEKEWGIEDFQVRIGIDTGLAAIGGQTEAEDTVKGRVVNLAVRIESAAPPGGLLISHNTFRHVRGVFTVEPQEPITAKGIPAPVPVYLVREVKPRAFRMQTRGVEGVETQMVGRRTEFDILKDALLTAFEESEGHVITISGEAGVGKSRLLYEYQNWLDLLSSSQGVRFFQGRGSQEAQGLPYSMLRDMFSFRFQVLDDDQGEQARRKVESGFCEVFGGDEDGVMRAHILGQLLGFNFSVSPHLKGVINDAEQLRNRGLMYLIQYFQALSQEMPIVIFLEDIHWGDDSSLDVISRIGELSPNYPILIVCACRPQLYERRPYWGEGKAFHKRLELHPLSKRESRQLVAEILKLTDDIPSELRELIVRGAEGNPFYTEELIKMLIEDGVVIPDEETWQIEMSRLEEVDVPSTLAGVLQARLDNLPTQERTVLQQASVVGRLFWDRIVSYIQSEGGNGGDLQLIPQTLTSLRNRELVYRHEESAFVGAVEYLFKHDVLREVTYESVIKRRRKTYHGMVADWLIENCGDRIGVYSGLIAEHLLIAGRNEPACEYFSHAGDIALNSYANSEAESYFRQALILSPDNRLKADLFYGLGEALYRQAHSKESESAWQQAIDLYQELRDYNNLGETYASLSWLIWQSEGYTKAWNVCQEGLKSLDGAPDSSGYAQLLAEAGRTAKWVKNEDVIPLCERAIAMAEGIGDLEVWAEANITLAGLLTDKPDYQRSVDLLQEIVSLTEAEEILRSASRAHNNLSFYLGYSLADLKLIISHQERAVKIVLQIGEVGNTLYTMYSLAEKYIQSGEIKSLENKLSSLLSGYINAGLLVKEVLQYSNTSRLFARGEWIQVLEAIQVDLLIARDMENIQYIADYNLNIADSLLELNRFSALDDLSECESALMENLEVKMGRNLRSLFLLAIMCVRQRRFAEANAWHSKAISLVGQYETDYSKTEHFNFDFELSLAKELWEKAVTACEKSIEIFKNKGYRWGWARKLIDLGDALIGRNEPGDLERARETYQQSLDMFTEMGAPGYIKVLEERLGEL